MVVGGETAAAPSDAATTSCASCSSPGPHSTIDRRPWRCRQRARDFREIHRRPSLVRPCRARIDDRETIVRAACRAAIGPAAAIAGIPILERKLDVRHADADRLQHRQILVNDVRRGLAGRLRVEQAGGALAQQLRRKSDDARCAGQSREHRRLQQPLKIERHIVPRAAQFAHRADDRAQPARARRQCADRRPAPDRAARDGGRRRASRCRASGCARRIAAAAGMAWMMSPSEPSRTMRIVQESLIRASRSRVE